MAVTLIQFVQHLTGSGLMSAAELQSFQEDLPPDRHPQDAESLARELVRANKLTKFQAQAIYQGKTKGLVLGNYVILDKLGEGGMGQVYKAQHKRMERIVALKVLPSSATKSPEAVQRFQREVKAAARLSHPNIVTAYDADEAQGMHFMVMEHIDGLDLGKVVKQRGPLPVSTAVDYLLQAAKGLQYAHEQGVIHRDIKPGNLLLDSHDTVKILDMGLARFEGAVGGHDDGLTQSGQVMGTLDYMAPEQAMDTKHADARSDIYSLGCTLYYLLTGRMVFPADTITKKIFAHAQQPIPALRAVRPDVPEAIDAAYQRMLAKTPSERPQTMAEVISALQGCLSTVGTKGQTGRDTLAAPPLPRPPVPAPPTPTSNLNRADIETSSAQFAIPGLSPSEMAKSVMLPRRHMHPRPKPKFWRTSLEILASLDKRLKIGLAGGVGLLFVAVLWAVMISLRTKEGTLIIELSEPDVAVLVVSEDGKVEIERPGEKDRMTITVDPGKHRLRLMKAGTEVFAKEFSIASGGREVIQARWEAKAKADVVKVPSIPATATAGESKQPIASRTPDPSQLADSSLPANTSVSAMSARASQETRATGNVVSDPGKPGKAAPPRRYCGYTVFGATSAVEEIAGYTNVLLDRGWLENGSDIVEKAKEFSLPVVLEFHAKFRTDIEDKLYPILDKHREAVLGVAWGSPYFSGYTANQVEDFGRSLKAKYPKLQYWVCNVEIPRGHLETEPVPPSVDVIVVDGYFDKTAEGVRAKTDRALPGWLAKANGRPVLYRWCSYDRKPPGLVPQCTLGTMRACFDAAQEHGLAGVLFWKYGADSDSSNMGQLGIESNPDLVKEIRGMVEELGWVTRRGPKVSSSTAASSPSSASDMGNVDANITPKSKPGTASPTSPPFTEPGFVRLFDGKTLNGWQGDKQHYRVEDGNLVSDFGPTPYKGTDGQLFTVKQYRDYIVRFEYRLSLGVNSGFLLRTAVDGTAKPTEMLEFQLIDESSYPNMPAHRGNGSLFGVLAPQQQNAKPLGEWNDIEISWAARHIKIVLNGTPIIDTDTADGNDKVPAGRSHPGLKLKSGHLGFQGASSRGRAEYRNIRIKVL